TRAERDGEHYVVNGQKAWNTLGQYADWIFCLVRTDPAAKPQRGISFLLVDMKTPGIRLQPTRLLDGRFEVNEVFFDNVRVPVGNLVGEENAGWTYAKFLLGHERTNIAGIGASRRELARLGRMAGELRREGPPLAHDPLFATRIAQVAPDAAPAAASWRGWGAWPANCAATARRWPTIRCSPRALRRWRWNSRHSRSPTCA